MIALEIDGKERVCLAQISNTLLRKFSYNEIHNRRVALGINCIQCTPLQLEILRSAGAMPVSSRRCGMITKREAERLVKSFLDDNAPPSLPDSFSFDVQHKCGYGCRGTFYPSRYNSSRAKCIRCFMCNAFFSPNKFIFHSHELPGSKYNQTGTVNFNSWRRHITLINEKNDDRLNNAWEDVKSIFNSGKRKRTKADTGGISDLSSDSESNNNLNSSFNDELVSAQDLSKKPRTKYYESQSVSPVSSITSANKLFKQDETQANTSRAEINLETNLNNQLGFPFLNIMNPIFNANTAALSLQMSTLFPDLFNINKNLFGNFQSQNDNFYLKTQELLANSYQRLNALIPSQPLINSDLNKTRLISSTASTPATQTSTDELPDNNSDNNSSLNSSAFKPIEKKKKFMSIVEHLE